MLKMNFRELMESGIIEEKFMRRNRVTKYDEDNETYRINLYVTGITACPCKCKFCRNTEMNAESTQFNTEAFKQLYEKYGRNIRTVTFGGGEPLLYFDKIIELINERGVGYSGRALITSGLKSLFEEKARKIREDYWRFTNKLEMDAFFETIYLSRHHANNQKNQESFGTKQAILEKEDIRLLPAGIVNKMVVTTTCYKGGTSTLEDMKDMVNWTITSTIPSIIFNDLQQSMTDQNFYEQHQIEEGLFEEFAQSLTELSDDFRLKHQIVFSGGYTVTTYVSEKLRLKVGFKKYHKSREETLKAWQNARKRTFDLTMEPDGTVYLDQL